MGRSYKEAQLSDPVTEWLEDRGMEVYAEIGVYRPIDLVAIDWDTEYTVSVSLKTCLTKKAREQAYLSQLSVEEAWVGVQSNPRKKSLDQCEDCNIGVLRVTDSGDVEVLFEPTQRLGTPSSDFVQDALIDQMRRYEPGGKGGYPNRKGEGPAQEVFEKVQRYKKQNPKATWKEIYENVPNHYASPNSMNSAMRSVRKRRRLRDRYEERKQTECAHCGHLGKDHRTGRSGFSLHECQKCDCREFRAKG